MPNDYINTITTNNGTTYDVQDKRLTVTAADAGKVVAVDENGNLTLVSGGTKLYKHQFSNWPNGGPCSPVITTRSSSYDTVMSYPLDLMRFLYTESVCNGMIGIMGASYGVLGFSYSPSNQQLRIHYLDVSGNMQSVDWDPKNATDTVTPL